MRLHYILLITTILTGVTATAQNKNFSKDGNQNSAIFLNAESDSKPRIVSLGLPTNTLGAVQIFEDGLPVSHYIYQLFPYKSWHGGASASRNGSMAPFEAAMRYGEVDTYVDSFNKLGSRRFGGTVSFMAGSFGQHKIDLNLTGPIGKRWRYSVSTYQNFDPGSNALPTGYLKDRHQYYKGVLTRDFKDRNGYMSLVYQYVDYRTINDSNGPFVFALNGVARTYSDFHMGTDCYIPDLTSFEYQDFWTGRMLTFDGRGDRDRTHHVTYLLERDLSDIVHLKFRSRLKTGKGYRASGSIGGINNATEADGYTFADGTPFSGAVQQRSLLKFDVNETAWMNNAEVNAVLGLHTIRAGLDYQLNHDDNLTSSSQFAHEVAKNPRTLLLHDHVTGNFNTSAEYYNGFENKAAVYAKEEWNINMEMSLAGFVRLEFQNLKGEAANNIGDDTSNTRYPGFDLTKGKITPFNDTFLNGAAGLMADGRLIGDISFHAEGVFTRIHNNLYNYGGFQYPTSDPTDTRFVEAGLSYMNSWLKLVSHLVYIYQSNYHSRATFSHTLVKPVGDTPAGAAESKVLPVSYGIESLGVTTDAVLTPFRNFSLHVQAIVRNPEYRNFVFNPTFSDGVSETYDFSGNNVTGLHKYELSLEPSYSNDSWRFWLTARYISKQYINKTNTLFFAGRIETFGGIDWQMNDRCRFNLNLVNLFNQTGASGSITAADLVTETSGFNNYLMAGKFIRPFTVELGVNVTF